MDRTREPCRAEQVAWGSGASGSVGGTVGGCSGLGESLPEAIVEVVTCSRDSSAPGKKLQ